MSVLVTGASGFIGSHMVGRLVNAGYTVHILIKPSSNIWRLEDIRKKITIHTVSLHRKDELTILLQKIRPSAIYHFAAHGAYATQVNVNEMIRVNISGLSTLLEASLQIPYTLFVNIGSSAEYGIKVTPMKETNRLEPVSFYASTKASGTLLGQVFAKTYHKPIITLRPFTVYGPLEEPFRFIPTVIRSILSDIPVKLTGKNVRHDYIFIDDFIDACVQFLTLQKGVSGAIYNVGTGKEYTNEDIVHALFRIAKKTVSIKVGDYKERAWDGVHWVADMSHTQKMLGWKPKYDLYRGLQATYDWTLRNQSLYGIEA